MRHPQFLAVALFVILVTGNTEAATAHGSRGMIATEHSLASQAGVEIFERGGNAIDAIVAAAFAAGVVNPSSSGIGGGGFLLIHDARNGKTHALDFREMAPAAAHRDLFGKPGSINSVLSRRGGLAVAVPGEVRGLAEAVRRWGTLPLATILEPAIRLASEGFPVGQHLARSFAAHAAEIKKSPELVKIYLDSNGSPLKEGAILQSHDLAKTLRTIARVGPDAFYEGSIAESIIAACRAAGGILTERDLAQYQVKLREPLRSLYRGHTIVSMGPPSSGGGVLLEILNILAGFDPGKRRVLDFHRLVEASKFAFADRAVFYGDSDFVDVPLARLLSKQHAANLRERIDQTRARVVPTQPAAVEHGGTAHLSAIGATGYAAALTTTINTAFGSMVVGTGTGIILNNEMDDFAAAPGTPNVYGLVGSQANSIAPGKRPLSSMSPTLVLRERRPVLAIGASGGPRIISATLQVILNIIDAGLPLPKAVSAPRFHHQWEPHYLYAEPDMPDEILTGLHKLGHQIRNAPKLAAVQAVQVSENGFIGVSDDRKGGVPVGW